MTTTLRLSLKKQYFDEIKSGKKQYEYRLMTPYWAKRLLNRNYDTIVLTLGYPPKFDTDRHLTLPFKNYVTTQIIHPHFGDKPVQVYAIDVSGAPLTEPDLYSLSADRLREIQTELDRYYARPSNGQTDHTSAGCIKRGECGCDIRCRVKESI